MAARSITICRGLVNRAASSRQRTESKSPAKVLLLGDTAVGKTSLLSRFVEDKFMVESLHSGLFVKEAMAEIGLEVWDFTGQENYESVTPSQYQGVDAAIVVYDITNIDSFVRSKELIDEVKERTNPRPLIILVGNKRDLELKRMVSRFHSEAYACENGVLFNETSAYTGYNVTEIFYEVARLVKMRESVSTSKDRVVKHVDNKRKRFFSYLCF